MKTKHGHDHYEALSAFQKSVRRGLEDEACYWGIELATSGLSDHLWTRIFIIAHEDIGLADPNMTQKVIAMRESYRHLKNKRPDKASGDMVLLQLIIEMARSPKSRYVDYAYIVYWQDHDNRKREVPDYALDGHTLRGKKMARGKEFFYEVSEQLSNRRPILDEMYLRTKAIATPEPKDDKRNDDQPELGL